MYHRYMQNDSGRFHKERIEKIQKPPVKKEPQRVKSQPLALLDKLFKGLDSGDLLVILILLLLLSEGGEECSSAIMTLVIFLFL